MVGHTYERFDPGNINKDPLDTLYWYRLPINLLPKSTLTPSDQIICMNIYQILVEILNWLAMWNRSNLTPGVALLSTYNHHPSTYHLKAALYAFQYVHS